MSYIAIVFRLSTTSYQLFRNTQMKPVILSILLFLFILPEGISQSGESNALRSIPLLKRFESTDYKGGIQSWSFDQDSLGILYVANNEGLLEFDGSKWIIHNVPFCTRVRAVLVDEQNRIFIGGQGQLGYFTMTEKGLKFISLLEYLPPEFQNIAEIWKIIEYDQKIYFTTESQLFVYDGNSFRVLDLPGFIWLSFKVGNKLLVQFYETGLFEFVDDAFLPIEGTLDIPEIISILPHKDGNYFFCRSGQIYNQTNQGIELLANVVETGTTNAAIKLSSGEYAIGTQNNGLYFLHPDLSFKQHITKNEGLSDRTIKSLYEDDFNNLWVALHNGIDYLALSLPFSLINEEVGMEGTGYAVSRYNDLNYFGTNNGLFVQKPKSTERHDPYYEIIDGSEGQVYNFSTIDNDLILNHHRGAFQVKEFELFKFHDIGSWKFVPTKFPDLILGGDYNGISLFSKRNNQWSKISTIPGLMESSRIMEFENDSTLWMTHGSKGAYRLLFDAQYNLKGKVEHFTEDHGFPSNIMISVYSLNEKLVFTSESGIYNFNYDSYSFSPIDFFNKWLGFNHVSEMVSNGSNRIYYIQDQMVGLLMQESFGTYKNETGLFKHINKLINDDLPNISLLDENNVLIGAKEGFIIYDPKKEFSVNGDFHTILRSIDIQQSSDSIASFNPDLLKKHEIAKNHSIKFHYSSPFFDGFEDIKYSYRLTPLDQNWSKWSSMGEKEYPYLPSGQYAFECKAINVYGQESPKTSFSFTVLRPWYLSGWAIIIYLILGLAAITLLPLLQRKKYREEKSEISQSKEQALRIKDEEISQLSEESKKEIDRLLNEKLRTEIDLKNDQLTTITMQFMNNNEFLQDALKKIETNIELGGSKQELKRILKTIDKNVSDNDSWDQFAYHFDQVHGDYLKKLSENNVRLSPREIKLAAFLRMNMSSKEISKMMNITSRSVELARYRLRKKLKLGRDQNLVEYLIELDSKKM